MEYDSQKITKTMQLCFKSLEIIAHSLKFFDVEVSLSIICTWIKKYYILINKYLD